MKITHDVGEYVSLNDGKTIVAPVEGGSCFGCALRNSIYCSRFNCTEEERKDGLNIHYVLVEGREILPTYL